jgi:phosphate/sulfate permease
MPFHQYDYILAIGTIFAALDAWNIGEHRLLNPFQQSE